MKIISSFIICLFAINCLAAKKQVAITFDDSPRHARGLFDGPTRAKKLIKVLKDNNVQAVFFSNTNPLKDEEARKRLQAYNDAGHFIANHTHSHPDFRKTSLKDYQANFMEAHKSLSKFSNFKKWFRFPYLREGNTREKVDGMRKTLKKMGYKNAYVTLDNSDWHMEVLMQEGLQQNPKLNMDKVREFYVTNMMASIRHYDDMANQYLGRSPKHILLLHEMDIAALYFGDLLKKMKSEGWEVISLEEALTDPIAKYQTTNVYSYNPGRIGEIAKDKGRKKNVWSPTERTDYLNKEFNKIFGMKLKGKF